MTEKKTHMLSEAEGYSLLRKYNVPAPVFEIVTSPEDAAKAAEKIGYPVVMKIVSPQIIHKSDAGGVVVGIPGLVTISNTGAGTLYFRRRL